MQKLHKRFKACVNCKPDCAYIYRHKTGHCLELKSKYLDLTNGNVIGLERIDCPAYITDSE